MNFKKILLGILFLSPLTANAQAISPAQIEQFKSLPRAQQEALAQQYGVDLSQISSSTRKTERQPAPEVVTPVRSQNGKDQEGREESGNRESGGNGQVLQPFGYDLFAGSPTTFAPVTEIPVPAEYTMGPGDVLRVQLWGNQNQQLELPVSRDGTIDFPERGPVSVAGLTFQQAREHVTQLVSE